MRTCVCQEAINAGLVAWPQQACKSAEVPFDNIVGSRGSITSARIAYLSLVSDRVSINCTLGTVVAETIGYMLPPLGCPFLFGNEKTLGYMSCNARAAPALCQSVGMAVGQQDACAPVMRAGCDTPSIPEPRGPSSCIEFQQCQWLCSTVQFGPPSGAPLGTCYRQTVDWRAPSIDDIVIHITYLFGTSASGELLFNCTAVMQYSPRPAGYVDSAVPFVPPPTRPSRKGVAATRPTG